MRPRRLIFYGNWKATTRYVSGAKCFYARELTAIISLPNLIGMKTPPKQPPLDFWPFAPHPPNPIKLTTTRLTLLLLIFFIGAVYLQIVII